MSLPLSVVFDCDGVLIDSNRVKSEAYRTALASEPPEHIDAFYAWFHAHPGHTRFALFEHFYANIAGAPDWRERVAAACAVFAGELERALHACSDVPGADAFLARLSAGGVASAIVSAALRSDLDAVVARRGWRNRFAAVCGGEKTKVAHIADLRASGVLRPGGLYFGDSSIDMDSAEATGCAFIYVSGCSEWRDGPAICRERGHRAIVDFTDPALDRHLAELGSQFTPG